MMASGTLVYPEHHFQPEDFLHFIETKPFTKHWTSLGLDDEALLCLQMAIVSGPKTPPVVRGTGGLRKLRFSPPNWPKGKSNALRACYAYFEAYHIVLLAEIYPKSTKDDLTPAERKQVKQALDRMELALSRKRYN